MTFTAEEAKAAFPDEVVTLAKTRLIKVPGLAKPVALITLDNGHDHTRPNTFGPQGLVSLNAALDVAFAAEPAAIAVSGLSVSAAPSTDGRQIQVERGIGATATWADRMSVAGTARSRSGALPSSIRNRSVSARPCARSLT